VVRLVHEYSLKPSSFTKWVRPLRKTPKMDPKPKLLESSLPKTPAVNAAA